MAVAWTNDGSLVDVVSTSGIPHEVAINAARYGAALSAVAPGVAGAYSRETGFAWAPFHTLILRGGDWTAVAGSRTPASG